MIAPVGPDERAGPLGRAATAPVGWLYTVNGERSATCFLVADWWIATAGHALPSAEAAADHIAVFNFLEGVAPGLRDAYAIAPESGWWWPAGLDMALVRLHVRPASTPPGQRWGRIALRPREASPGDAVVCVQHRARPAAKAFSLGAVVAAHGATIEHDAPCEEGSSGAPLLDASGGWLGVHEGRFGATGRATAATAVVAAIAAARWPVAWRQEIAA